MIFRRLKNTSSPYCNILPTIILKKISWVLIEPLCKIFNSCLASGIYPNVWKTSYIVPIPKDKKINIHNLRPISLLPTLSKVFEKVILNLYGKELYATYDTNQYGFRPKSSTHSALISLLTHTLSSMDKPKKKNFIISFDIRKAFDTINHDKLLEYLLDLNLPSKFINLIKNYLQNRQQCVIYNGTYSDKLPILSGIPQGSVLGPVLFCLYINTLKPSCNNIPYIKYADDTTFLVSIDDLENESLILQNEIKFVDKWCSEHHMSLNKEKTKILYLNSSKKIKQIQDGTDIGKTITNQITFLGFIISHDLKWTTQVDKMVSKISSRLHLLRILKKSLLKNNLIVIYNALIQSILDYNFPLITSMTVTDIGRLNSMIKRAHYIICGQNCSNRCLPEFKSRCYQKKRTYFLEMLNNKNHIIHHLIPNQSCNSNRIILPLIPTNRSLNSFINSSIIDYNNQMVTTYKL